MRRLARASSSGGTPPPVFSPATPSRRLFAPLPMANGDASGCWRCSDAPCCKFDPTEVARPLPLAPSMNPELRVCPTDAIAPGTDGLPTVDTASCIGCGLCVTRCPVGAIHLAPADGVAVVEELTTSGPPTPLATLQELRVQAAGLLEFEQAPFADADLVNVQHARTTSILPRAGASGAIRLLVRNAFLLADGSARLSNRGDNSDWAEVVASSPIDPDIVGAIQIEADLSLDAHRRLLAGLAIGVSRLGADLEKVVPIIVMLGQPNLRTDYYRVVADAAKYLNIRIRTVPLTVLYLGIRGGGYGLLRAVHAGAFVDTSQPSNGPWVEAAFGAPADSTSGVRPSK